MKLSFNDPDRAEGNLTEDRRWRDFTYDADVARERGDGLTLGASPKGCFRRAPVGRWKRQNRLISAQTRSDVAAAYPSLNQLITYVYDSQNRRVSKTVSNWSGSAWVAASQTLFVYDGWNLVAELDGLNSDAILCKYAWGLDASDTLQGAGGVGGLLFATIPGSGSNSGTFAPGYDGNGDIVAWINQSSSNLVAGASQTAGSLAGDEARERGDGLTLGASPKGCFQRAPEGRWKQQNDWNPFGESMKCTGIAQTLNLGFSTKYLDRETGLYYYCRRYYNPSTGRFTSEDPLGEAGGINLYGFCLNDGIIRFDASGEAPSLLEELIGIWYAKNSGGSLGDQSGNLANKLGVGPSAQDYDVLTPASGDALDAAIHGILSRTVGAVAPINFTIAKFPNPIGAWIVNFSGEAKTVQCRNKDKTLGLMAEVTGGISGGIQIGGTAGESKPKNDPEGSVSQTNDCGCAECKAEPWKRSISVQIVASAQAGVAGVKGTFGGNYSFSDPFELNYSVGLTGPGEAGLSATFTAGGEGSRTYLLSQ